MPQRKYKRKRLKVNFFVLVIIWARKQGCSPVSAYVTQKALRKHCERNAQHGRTFWLFGIFGRLEGFAGVLAGSYVATLRSFLRCDVANVLHQDVEPQRSRARVCASVLAMRQNVHVTRAAAPRVHFGPRPSINPGAIAKCTLKMHAPCVQP